jgi:hypothetical protein
LDPAIDSTVTPFAVGYLVFASLALMAILLSDRARRMRAVAAI